MVKESHTRQDDCKAGCSSNYSLLLLEYYYWRNRKCLLYLENRHMFYYDIITLLNKLLLLVKHDLIYTKTGTPNQSLLLAKYYYWGKQGETGSNSRHVITLILENTTSGERKSYSPR